MSGDDLSSASDARLKLYRAAFHLATLDTEINKFISSDAYTVERAGDGSRFRLRVRGRPHPGWGVLIGDFAHNLRSAIDHLIWSLAIQKTPSPDRRIEFPIFDTNREADINRNLKYVDDQDTREGILRLQPFQYDIPRNTLLWMLHALDIVDKHRRLSVAILAVGISIRVGSETYTFPTLGAKIDDGTEIPFTLDENLRNLDAEMLAHPSIAVTVDEQDYSLQAQIYPDSDLTQVYSLVEREIFPLFEK